MCNRGFALRFFTRHFNVNRTVRFGDQLVNNNQFFHTTLNQG